MERHVLLSRLEAAKENVAQDEIRIMRQKEVVAKLHKEGGETVAAIALLETFEDIQRKHLEDLEGILNQLDSQG